MQILRKTAPPRETPLKEAIFSRFSAKIRENRILRFSRQKSPKWRFLTRNTYKVRVSRAQKVNKLTFCALVTTKVATFGLGPPRDPSLGF